MDDEYGGGPRRGPDIGPGRSRPRPPRDPMTPDYGQQTPALARTSQLVTGDFLLTVNPVDGSEVEHCPPGERPERPTRRGPAERAELRRAGRPPVPAGPAPVTWPLLERGEERERLARLLARGRSVRLTGPAGSGRTALLDEVAEESDTIAPDGVVRLSGRGRTPGDLLYALFAEVYEAPFHRPDRALLLELVHDIGAVVVLDDLEFGGAALDELLDATPECAFLVAATPDVAAPSADSRLEEVFLGGVGRGGGLELLERAVGRPLGDEEANWAGDLWFESEGLPLRFVQAGALLVQRDQLRADPGAFGDDPVDVDYDMDGTPQLPLPTVGEGAAPAPVLAARLSESARATLRFAVALGGEVPHQAHLPALVGDTHADAALAELVTAVLVTPAGGSYRLAAGVLNQLESAGYTADVREYAETAARHYAWWAGHPSVTAERVCAEADAVLAALTASVAARTPAPDGTGSAAVLLARAAAPAFAAGLLWGAWERSLRSGQEAARIAGEVAEEAYFHHELGVLALCEGQLDRARAELEASIGLRGALADRRGTVAGRRALALVADRSAGVDQGGRTAAGEEVPGAGYEESASPPGGVPEASVLVAGLPEHLSPEPETVTRQASATGPIPPGPTGPTGPTGPSGPRAVLTGARRNLVAAGAGALLVAVLGTVVTLGATSDNDDAPGDRVKSEQSASTDDGDNGLTADRPDRSDSTSEPGDGVTDPGEDGVLGTADDPTPSSGTPSTSASTEDSDSPSGSPSGKPSDDAPGKPTHKPTDRPTDKPTKPTKPPTSGPETPPTSEDPPTDPTTDPPTDPPPTSPETSDSASGAAPTVPADGSASATKSAAHGSGRQGFDTATLI
ncbi:ATP-binding protein [Streptomyces tsukubensis]|uniref:AAA family ATPase n=1 Tax=Streptomyces tsukubensis TaxID=83656 RepID=A0A1V3ZZQ8_9ACTN|nr:AAA family ATPase [Streptomyces tsukubensis]QFR98019.1 ATP-binding protein [Streptomyces tsukubensis]